MKILFLVLGSLLIGINSYADVGDSCGTYSPERGNPTCMIVRQLEDLNRKIDQTNQKLNDIKSDVEKIQSKIDNK